jgi:hypothetical protein
MASISTLSLLGGYLELPISMSFELVSALSSAISRVLVGALLLELGLDGLHLAFLVGGLERRDLHVLGVGLGLELLDLVLAVDPVPLERRDSRGGRLDQPERLGRECVRLDDVLTGRSPAARRASTARMTSAAGMVFTQGPSPKWQSQLQPKQGSGWTTATAWRAEG